MAPSTTMMKASGGNVYWLGIIDLQSFRFENNHNFQIYGHQKFKVGAIRSYGNVIAYASGFGEKWKSPGNTCCLLHLIVLFVLPHYTEYKVFVAILKQLRCSICSVLFVLPTEYKQHNLWNRVLSESTRGSTGTILEEPNAMFDNKIWFMDRATYHSTQGWTGNRSHNNALVGSGITLSEGKETLAQWQAKDPKVNDVGSTYLDKSTSTQSSEIILAAREVLASVLA